MLLFFVILEINVTVIWGIYLQTLHGVPSVMMAPAGYLCQDAYSSDVC